MFLVLFSRAFGAKPEKPSGGRAKGAAVSDGNRRAFRNIFFRFFISLFIRYFAFYSLFTL
jgi:hypothetical protein